MANRLRLVLALLVALGGACRRPDVEDQDMSWTPLLRRAGITDQRIIAAFEKVPRAEFLPIENRYRAFRDEPVEIGYQQTTSQPSLIAYMIQQLELQPGCRVLEVGTGCGYQAALLGELCQEVYTIDIVEPLARGAARILADRGYTNVEVRAGDGYAGWPEKAPFDAIVVTAGAAQLPPALVPQLTPTGKLIIPLGEEHDMELRLLSRRADGTVTDQHLIPVHFVPLTGRRADADRELER